MKNIPEDKELLLFLFVSVLEEDLTSGEEQKKSM